MERFHASKKKVERAEKHIRELYDFVQAFPAGPDFHSVTIEQEIWHSTDEFTLTNDYIRITIHKSKDEFLNETALIMGDIYHNLRSALDILWYEIVSPTGLQTNWTRFPVEDTREELETPLDAALKKGQISDTVHGFVLNVVKPYLEGNFRIWSIHEMNQIDKHKLLIPTFPMMAIEGIRVQNGEQIIEFPVIFTDSSFRRLLSYFGEFGRDPKVNNKGHVSIGQGFDLGTAHIGQPVIPTLNAVAKEVTRTIEAFETLLFGEI